MQLENRLYFPPCSRFDELKRDGHRYWIRRREPRSLGLGLLALGVSLALAAGLAYIGTDTLGETTVSSIAAFVTSLVVIIPLIVAGLVCVFTHANAAMLDLKSKRLYRIGRFSGRPVDSRSTNDLFIVHGASPAEDDTTTPPGTWIVACGPDPSFETEFRVTLWDQRSGGYGGGAAVIDALLAVLPWKGTVDRDGRVQTNDATPAA